MVLYSHSAGSIGAHSSFPPLVGFAFTDKKLEFSRGSLESTVCKRVGSKLVRPETLRKALCLKDPLALVSQS